MSSDRALYLRENAGVVQTLDNRAFDAKAVDAAFEEPPYRVAGQLPQVVFVCIDTAGGGQSCTAVCTGFYTSRQLVLLGAESFVLSTVGPPSAPRFAAKAARRGDRRPLRPPLRPGRRAGGGAAAPPRRGPRGRRGAGALRGDHRAKLRGLGVRLAGGRGVRPVSALPAHDARRVGQAAHRGGDHARGEGDDAVHVAGQTTRRGARDGPVS